MSATLETLVLSLVLRVVVGLGYLELCWCVTGARHGLGVCSVEKA